MTPFGKVVMVTLVCYFSYEIYKASNKLASRDIGTIFMIENEKFHMKAIDKPSQHCNAESTETNTSACIADFIEREIGCNLNILGSQHSERSHCSTKAELLQL